MPADPAEGAPDDAHTGSDPDGGSDRDGRSDPTGSDGDALLVTERQTQKGLLVSVCDDDALGKTYEEGEVSLTVTEEFYGGDALAEPEALDSLARASVANIVGVRAVELAIEAGYVDEANVLEIDGTRHAQFMRL